MKKLFMSLMIAVVFACSGSVNAMQRFEAAKVAFSNKSPFLIKVFILDEKRGGYSKVFINPLSDREFAHNIDIPENISHIDFSTQDGQFELTFLENIVGLFKTHPNRDWQDSADKMIERKTNIKNILVMINHDGSVKLIDRSKL